MEDDHVERGGEAGGVASGIREVESRAEHAGCGPTGEDHPVADLAGKGESLGALGADEQRRTLGGRQRRVAQSHPVERHIASRARDLLAGEEGSEGDAILT